MTERLVVPLAKINVLYKYAMAQLLVNEQKYDQAAQQYLAAIAQMQSSPIIDSADCVNSKI
jgi:hypothetical protein